jgi:hypothetical protein
LFEKPKNPLNLGLEKVIQNIENPEWETYKMLKMGGIQCENPIKSKFQSEKSPELPKPRKTSFAQVNQIPPPPLPLKIRLICPPPPNLGLPLLTPPLPLNLAAFSSLCRWETSGATCTSVITTEFCAPFSTLNIPDWNRVLCFLGRVWFGLSFVKMIVGPL